MSAACGQSPHVLVLGAGAIGGFLGARLIEAGARVTFLVRPARAERLRRDGLRILSEKQPFAAPVRVLTAVDDDRHGLILLACKAYDLDSAIAALRPAMGAQTRLLPLLNGLAHLDRLDAEFGAERILGGLCQLSVTLQDDGVIRHFGPHDRLIWGSRTPADPALPRWRALLAGMRSEVIESRDIHAAMWAKFAFIAALAGITCLLRGSIGAIAAAGGGALAQRLHRECADVAERSGHAIDPAQCEESMRVLVEPASALKASMLRDIERGARTEGVAILGDMLMRARGFGMDTPLLEAAARHVAVYEATRPGGR
ncbi:MAG: 2-dehydropantoate 2-reductase [Xanthomonadaceae bacterium]|nr:2-dehydropantoate 2-reductase [Xanthomonadaceae bacterium]MDE2178434.1 2-dehydropantoate 2-reductase [Xanthomonadaceae bacterium]MDE2244849.1 2-dehydropantoate 2-reductase [Xanthomonadaceae bacterium]